MIKSSRAETFREEDRLRHTEYVYYYEKIGYGTRSMSTTMKIGYGTRSVPTTMHTTL